MQRKLILTASLAAVLLAFTMEPAAAQRAERMFDAIDADGDGNVTASEIDQMRTQRFDRLDRNDDGVLRAREIERMRARARRMMEDRVETADADGDGKITQTEFAAMPKTLLVEGDADGDGNLTLAEFEAFLEDLRANR
jgi:Ca2+-binding EF-hand superfamily protein